MKITYTFANHFSDLLLAKCYRFAQRSASRYAVAAALLTLGLHFSDQHLSWVGWVSYGLGYYLLLCLLALLAYLFIAYRQSKPLMQSQLSFCDTKIIFEQQNKGQQRNESWTNIHCHSLHSALIVFSFKQAPQKLFFIHKKRLAATEFTQLSQWFIRCRTHTQTPDKPKK